ncbi:MAG: alcohol dehydrogenase catalytic domain-containing protein, partial [Actinobacteria bacterium]|nr:alcohol dehydrogenase catalytic domain-containing protein [Actinomycetota bacterium]
MRAVVTVAPRQMQLQDVPPPDAPVAGEALVRVEAVGLCGSDLHLFSGDHPYSHFPNRQGHEFGGIVEAIGPGYTGPARVGDRVAVEPLRGCGTCFACRRNRPNCCVRIEVLGAQVPGALADRVTVPASTLYPVGDLSPELAALVEPISIGYWAVVRGAVAADDTVVVFGAGPIGQAILLACVDRDARVLVVDRLPARLDLARTLGAAMTVDVTREQASHAVAGWTDGDGPSIVFDATGVPAVVRSAIDVVAPAGRVVIVGLSNEDLCVPLVEFTRKELTVLGSRNSTGIFGQAVDLVRRRRDGAERL